MRWFWFWKVRLLHRGHRCLGKTHHTCLPEWARKILFCLCVYIICFYVSSISIIEVLTSSVAAGTCCASMLARVLSQCALYGSVNRFFDNFLRLLPHIYRMCMYYWPRICILDMRFCSSLHIGWIAQCISAVTKLENIQLRIKWGAKMVAKYFVVY